MELKKRYGESDTEMEIYTEIASGDNRTEQDRIYETLQHGTGELADKTTPSAKKCTRCTLVNSILIGLLIIAVSVSVYMSTQVSKASNNKGATVTGIWTHWSDWSPCNAKCGQGFKWRIRSCTSVSPKDIGFDCNGNSTETVQCQNSECSADLQKLVTNLSQNIDKLEHAQEQIQTEILKNLTNRLNEPIDGGWTEWNPMGQCPVSCGVGLQSRTRSCTNPSPANAGKQCVGQNLDVKLCYRGFCEVDGGWTEWNPWGQCPVSCGVGLQSRSRSCTNPSPANAGKQCVGQNFDVKLCYRGFCEAEDCYAIKKHRGKLPSGIYDVRLWNASRVIPVYCDFDTDTGGWTVFQYRFNGSVDFYRNFSDYERGFGSLHGEFWLGLENIYEMVSRGKTELRLDLTAADGTSVYETFQNFRLDEMPYYTLHIDKGVGTAGDSNGLSYHNGRHFSTFDMDRDGFSYRNCAILDHGGWWYNSCAHANLNGEYVTPGTRRPVRDEGGMIYNSFRWYESLKVSKLMFRRV